MKISLIDLDVEIETERIPQMTAGAKYDTGEIESWPSELTIISVKANGIELISLLTSEELSELNEKLKD